MGANYDFKKEKCWSCEFYCGNRQYKKGAFLGDSVNIIGKGRCSCKNSSKNGQEVSEEGWCSKYQKWGVIQSTLAFESQKRESQRLQEENNRRQREIERERKKLEEERKRLEHEKWYESLSPSEQAAEDLKNALRRREEKERKAEEARLAELKKKKRKKIRIIGWASAATLLVVFILIATIPNAIKKSSFEKSDTGKLLSLIRKETDGKDEFYFYVDRKEGCRAYLGFEYKKNGWKVDYGEMRDFRVWCQLTPRKEDHYDEITGFCFFNLKGTENSQTDSLNGKGATFWSYARYDSYSCVLTEYEKVTFANSTLQHEGQFYRYENWDKKYNANVDEWTERGFIACELVNILVNQYCLTAFGSSFWK